MFWACHVLTLSLYCLVKLSQKEILGNNGQHLLWSIHPRIWEQGSKLKFHFEMFWNFEWQIDVSWANHEPVWCKHCARLVTNHFFIYFAFLVLYEMHIKWNVWMMKKPIAWFDLVFFFVGSSIYIYKQQLERHRDTTDQIVQ